MVPKLSRTDYLALLLSLLGLLAAAFVTERVFEQVPHIEDEIAYVWQANLIAEGHLTTPSPPFPNSFMVPFVVDYAGQRFGKYPLGWPAMMAVGIRLGLRSWINPFLAGLAVWLTYRLGKRLFGASVGLLAAALTLTSPFFLMNSGSLLSHPFGLVLSAAFALSWLEAFTRPVVPRRWLPVLAGGLSLGVLALTRPMTAVALALPFVLHALYLLWRGDAPTRRAVLAFGLLAGLVAALHFFWQYTLTGNALLNLYTLWWPYDTIGFGPGVGRAAGGHTLRQAWINTRFSLHGGVYDLFGWGSLSWLFLPFGIWAARRNRPSWLVGIPIVSIMLAYMAYWIGSSLFGPRYYYESLFSLTIFTAAGIAWLARWPLLPSESFPRYTDRRKFRPLLTVLLVGLLVSVNLIYYAPIRLGSLSGLYTIRRTALEPFQAPQAQALTPALVIVHSARWMPYGALLELENPSLTSPFIFAWSLSTKTDAAVALSFPDRQVIHYYPDEPGRFYTAPRSSGE